MPITVNVGASRKIADNNYGSRGASVNIELELESGLIGEPAKLHDKIRQLFGLVKVSLAEELNGNGHTNGNTQAAGQPNGANGNGASPRSNPSRPATASQVKAIYAIAKGQRLNLNQFLRDRFQVGRPEDLGIKQASAVIDELKSSRANEGG